jgi:hypothetical protein
LFRPGGSTDPQQVDLRGRTAAAVAEVSSVELLEVHLNAVAPFLLNARLKPLPGRRRDKHVVNVLAVEGQFGMSVTPAIPTPTWPRPRST